MNVRNPRSIAEAYGEEAVLDITLSGAIEGGILAVLGCAHTTVRGARRGAAKGETRDAYMVALMAHIRTVIALHYDESGCGCTAYLRMTYGMLRPDSAGGIQMERDAEGRVYVVEDRIDQDRAPERQDGEG